MKLAIAYSTKDQVELTRQTMKALVEASYDELPIFYWADGSTEAEALSCFANSRDYSTIRCYGGIKGGADAAIAWKLSTLLKAPDQFTHIGLLENDVLLDPDWLEPTLELFEKGAQDGLSVGAVSPRSYVDRVLIQRDGWAVMHNIGAGAIIFTRDAAEIILRTFRTAWWPDNVRLFAQISGIDLRTYACFRGNEQWVTTDWGWEAQLARHGLASLALTPAKCTMTGQVPPLAEQGLELTTGPAEERRNDDVFRKYRACLDNIRKGYYVPERPDMIARHGAEMRFFPHQLPAIDAVYEKEQWKLFWCQGHGPFAYQAGPGGASLTVRVSGHCSCLAAGGRVTVEDTRSGFKTSPNLPNDQIIEIQNPGTPVPREIRMTFAEGAVFYGLQTADPQMIDTTWKFDWQQLPEPM